METSKRCTNKIIKAHILWNLILYKVHFLQKVQTCVFTLPFPILICIFWVALLGFTIIPRLLCLQKLCCATCRFQHFLIVFKRGQWNVWMETRILKNLTATPSTTDVLVEIGFQPGPGSGYFLSWLQGYTYVEYLHATSWDEGKWA